MSYRKRLIPLALVMVLLANAHAETWYNTSEGVVYTIGWSTFVIVLIVTFAYMIIGKVK